MTTPKGLLRFSTLLAGSFLVTFLAAVAPGHFRSSPWYEGFWAAFFVEGTYQQYETAADAVKASDAVIVGRIVDVSKAREVDAIPEWGIDGVLTFAAVSIEVDRVVVGRVENSRSGALTWEAWVPDSGAIDEMGAKLPREPVLMFITKLDDSNSYILLNPESYLVNAEGVARVALGAAQEWALAWEGREFESVVREIGSLGQAPS